MDYIFHIAPLAAALLYVISSVGYIRALAAGRELSARARTVIATGLGFHLVFLVSALLRIESNTEISSVIFSAAIATVVGCLLLFEARFKIKALGAFIAPLAGILMLVSGFLFHLPTPTVSTVSSPALLWTHITLVVFGYALFVVAFGISTALLLQEHIIRKKSFSVIGKNLPSLAVLDVLHIRVLSVGFFLMLTGIGLGLLLMYKQGVSFKLTDSILLWSLSVLAVYGVLLADRMIRGVSGRKAALVSIAGFFVLLISFVGAQVFGGSFHAY